MAPILSTSTFAFVSRNLPSLFDGSAEYRPVTSQRLEDALVLADRIVAACEGRPEFARIAEITDGLSAAARAQGEGRIVDSWRESGQWLKQHLEHWLKAILWVIDLPTFRELHEKAELAKAQNRTARFNLFEVLIRLELLTVEEANQTTVAEIGDPVRRIIWAVRNRRNAQTHDASTQPDQQDLEFALLGFVAPILKHHAVLRDALRGLITRPLELDNGLIQTLRTIAEVQGNHMDRFAGRAHWLKLIPDRLARIREAGGYVILTGPEGQGKSALMAKTADALTTRARRLGSDAPKVVRDAPWLPGAMLHFGKQSSKSEEITALILAQANAMLVRPVPITPLGYPSTFSAQLDADQTGHNAQRMLSRFNLGDRVEQPRDSVSGLKITGYTEQLRHYSRLLHWALQRVVEEHGTATLIVDALDEIARDGSDLAFLPDPVPPGAVVLTTVRPNLKLDLWLKLNRTNVEVFSLDNLSRDETSLLTKVDESQDHGGKRFNDEAHKRSNGWAYVLAAVGREVERADGKFQTVSLAGIAENLLERQLEEWRKGDAKSQLHSCLLLLAIYEPCGPLTVDEIQGFLLSSGHQRLSRADTVEILRGVGPQIEGLTAGRVKLAQSVFAQYVRSPYLSQRDLTLALLGVATWLSDDPDVRPETVASFLGTPTPAGEPVRPHEIGERISSGLAARRAADKLCDVALRLLKRKDSVALGMKLLESAAELGEQRALAALGNRCIDGRGVSRDPDRGKSCLLRAAEEGHVPAMISLGGRLLDGAGLEVDLEAGEGWLRRAAASGDARAEGTLALRLLFRDRLIPNKAYGLTLLRRAAEKHSEFGNVLAALLIDGTVVSKDSAAGVGMLRDAAQRRDYSALRTLGERLCDGIGVQANRPEGERLLLEAAEGGDVGAMISLGSRLIEGRSIAADPVAGERWLQRAIDEGSGQAVVVLVAQLLPGGRLQTNEGSALALLKRTADRGVTKSKRELARRLLHGDGLDENPEEGVSVLHRLIDDGDVMAQQLLGAWLLRRGPAEEQEGKRHLREASRRGDRGATSILIDHLLASNDAEARVEGEKYLRREALCRDEYRIRELGERLARGRGLRHDPIEAAAILRSAAANGFVEPMIALSNLILEGDLSSNEPGEARAWLSAAAEQGDREAQLILSKHLIDDGGSATSQEQGRGLLLALAQQSREEAIVELAERMFEGRGFPKDANGARMWLERGIARGHVSAHHALAARLFEGDGVEKETSEALRLISDLADRGDWEAQVELGHRLIRGDGVPRDRAGIKVLSDAAAKGNHAAAHALGKLFLDGQDVAKDVNEGERLLRLACAAAYPPAMVALGSRLIDGQEIGSDPQAGRAWLEKATAAGSSDAMLKLAVRLLVGHGLAKDARIGEALLWEAARQGDTEAMIELGSRLIEGDCVTVDRGEGVRWLRRASNNHPDALSQIGIQLFQRGHQGAAIEAFVRAFEAGSQDAGNNIAYIVRRGELSSSDVPHPIDYYLEIGLRNGSGFNRLNLALAFAKGFQRETDWARADDLVRQLNGNSDVAGMMDWWHTLAKNDDGEGHLVIGWLAHHSVIIDPDGRSVSDRLQAARSQGWAVPDGFLDTP